MKQLIFTITVLFSFKILAQSQLSGYCGPKDNDGNYGTNCEWVYDDDSKTLTISGEGKMYDTSRTFDYSFSSISGIKNVIIEEGITNLGSHTFYGMRNLENIAMPDTLTSIGWNAFTGGTQLTSIIIPNSVTYMGGSDQYSVFGQTVTSVYCSEAQKNMCRQALEWSGLDVAQVLKTYQKYGDEYYYGGRFYQSENDIGTTNYIKKRIYTIDEANRVSGNKNTFKIKYK